MESICQICVKTNADSLSCEFTVYRIRNCKKELVFTCRGAIGKNGIGKRREGDGKTPLGTFTTGSAYGIKDNPESDIPYTKITDEMYWCGDSSSPDYNTLRYATRLGADTDFSHDEHLIEYGEVYNYLLDIGYNKERIPYAGSAIFLHCQKSMEIPTEGCIAIPEKYMIKTLRTITHGTKITIY